MQQLLQKIAFHPLTHKSMKSMQAMQAVQPKVQAIQERYKNNPQKKQEETMALYRKHGVNPMGGCLPMLAQIPHVLLAAHAGTIMGVETNAMQFYPEASQAEAAVHPGLYRRRAMASRPVPSARQARPGP